MKYQNVLITGGAGKLGRYVYELLDKCGYTVTLFDQFTPQEVREPWKCDALFVKGSLTDLGDCMRAITLAEADVIVHLGALPHDSDKYPGCRDIPWRRTQVVPEDTTMLSNVMGTYYLMDAARRLKIKKVIFASSFFTLGIGFRISNKPFQIDYLPMDEEHASRPEDTYSLSKVIGEEIMKAYARAYDIKTVALRFLGVTFPFRDNTQISIEQVKEAVAKQDPNKAYDMNVGMYVDARDIANVIKLAIEKDLDSNFEAFFTATGSNIYDATAQELLAVTRPDLKDMAKDIPEGETCISFKKLRDVYGYEPQYFMKKPEGVE